MIFFVKGVICIMIERSDCLDPVCLYEIWSSLLNRDYISSSLTLYCNSDISLYWVSQKVHLGFLCYRKTQTKVFASPIIVEFIVQKPS